MTAHTPEPWKLSQDGTITNAEGYVTLLSQSPQARTNAARIVACVNACAGINPEAVPDLRTALRHILEDLDNWDDGITQASIIEARAALAKARQP
jgi:hypothetical protein